MKVQLLLALSVFLGLSGYVFAQTQQGYVKTKGRMMNGKYYEGKRISDATVQIKNLSAMRSRADGTFSFPVSGKYYSLQQVTKQGYILFDQDMLYRQYDYSSNPLEIVMEDKVQLEADRRALEREVRRITEEELRRRGEELEALKMQNKITEEKYRELLNKLNTDYDQNEKLIKDLVKQYNKIDFDQMDEFNRRVSDCIINGRLDEADSLLHTKGDINERIKRLEKHHTANEQARTTLSQSEAAEDLERHDIAQDCYNKFQMFKMLHQNDSAVSYIEKRAELDSTNIEWQKNAGDFLWGMFLYSPSEKYYSRALKQCKQSRKNIFTKEYELKLMVRIAELYKNTSRFGECQLVCNKVLNQCSNYQDSSFVFEMIMLDAYRLMLDVAIAKNQIEESASIIKEKVLPVFISLQTKTNQDTNIVHKIADDEYDLFITSYFGCLNQFGLLCIANQKYEDAEGVYNEIIDVSEKLGNDLHVIASLYMLSVVYEKTRNFERGEECVQKALKINMKYLQEDTVDIAISLVEINLLKRLTFFCYIKEQYIECEKKLDRAYEILEQVSKNNSRIRQSGYLYEYYADIATMQGEIYAKQNDYLKALAKCETAYNYFNLMQPKVSKQDQRYYSCLVMLSFLNSLSSNKQFAYKINGELLPLLSERYKNDPTIKDLYSSTLGSQAYYAIFNEKFEEAERLSRESLKIDSSQEVPVTNLAASLLLQGKYSEAEKLYIKYKKRLKDAFLQDLTDFENAGIIPAERKKDVMRIMDILSK